ncbi:hypothetical protein [Sphingosinithalassobacter portus]|uniref:hypothetical protein n=1 Tax=Stakelama portus TaxID=2676234 RepID=UPI0011AB8310|nr:hypothetical protein [Sphingosinithalassobacter portus]
MAITLLLAAILVGGGGYALSRWTEAQLRRPVEPAGMCIARDRQANPLWPRNAQARRGILARLALSRGTASSDGALWWQTKYAAVSQLGFFTLSDAEQVRLLEQIPVCPPRPRG